MINEVDLKHFLNEVNHRLHMARRLDQERSQTNAHRFNVFDYLNTREQGLSLVLADLFNPIANHGQGILFLKEFLKELKLKFDINLPDFDANDVDVRTEETISKGRRIDIYITIKESYCLAIENKPYAKDQDNQISDYLEHLEKSFPDPNNFLLVYLSPDGGRPDEYSLSSAEYENWKGHFALMAYHSKPGMDNDDFLVPFALSEWLAVCRKSCKAGRLHWFLRDLKTFCTEKFGGEQMTMDIDTKEIKRLVFSDLGKYLDTTKTIARKWPEIENNIYQQFAEKLFKRIEESIEDALPGEESLEFDKLNKMSGGKRLYLRSKSWKNYQTAKGYEDWNVVGIEPSNSSELNDWFIGVYRPRFSDLDPKEEDRWKTLDERFGQEFDTTWKDDDKNWHIYRYLKKKYRNWRDLIPEIHRELNGEKTEIIDYYSNEFLELVKKAVPIVNEVESSNK